MVKMIKRILLPMAVMLLMAGCQGGDFRISPVIAGQPAPHAGYNIGPEIYVDQGHPAVVTGAVIWIRGLDPNSLD